MEEYQRIRAALVEHSDLIVDLIAVQLAQFGSKAEWPMDEVLDATDELVRLAQRIGLPPAGDQDASALAFYRAASAHLGLDSGKPRPRATIATHMTPIQRRLDQRP